MKILIRNLARSITDEAVQALFEAHGAVQSCTLVKDKLSGASKGFGFVEMPRAGEAKVAIKSLNGKEIEGLRIRVKKAENSQSESPDPESTEVVDKTLTETKPSAPNLYNRKK